MRKLHTLVLISFAFIVFDTWLVVAEPLGLQDGSPTRHLAGPGDIAEAREKSTLTASATTILDGMVRAFLDRPSLPEDELRCADQRVDELAGDVMKASHRTVLELARALDPPYHQEPTEKRLALPNISDGLVSIIRLQSDIADRCMQGRSLDTFNLAAHHLRNLSYVGGHLVANGADIIPELQDAILAFRAGRLHTFGEDLGRAWRKVLLSRIQHLTRNRNQDAVRKTSLGLVKGFFSDNIRLEWISSHKGHPHKFEIDLHQCTNGQNEKFFQEVWDATWLFFEQVAASKGIASNHELQSLLMVVLADLPTALRYCGITEEQEAFLTKSLKALQQLRFDVDVAHKKVHTNEISVDLAQAIEHWTAQRWTDFGNDLGKMFQELVLLAFPREYEVGSSIWTARKVQGEHPWLVLLMVVPIAGLIVKGGLHFRRRTDYCDEAQLDLEQVLE